MTQLNTYVDARLSRWAAWYHSTSNPMPKRVRSQMAGVLAKAGDTDGLPWVKFDVGECDETDRAVDALEEELRDAVRQVYLFGGTMEQKARALHCDRRTIYRRIERAAGQLLGYFNDLAAGIALPRPKWRTQMREKILLTTCHKNRTFAATVA